jgi:hypothetical protein
MFLSLGMGKTKLLVEVRKSLERINTDLSAEQGKPGFHLFFGVADIANKSQKLHPWRRIFQVSQGLGLIDTSFTT